MARVLFIYPNALRYNFIPTGLASIAAVAQEAGLKLSLCDLTFLEDFEIVRVFIQQLLETSPEILAIHCSSADWPLVNVILEVARAQIGVRPLTVVGGPHTIALPEQIIESDNIDVVLLGEGEDAFRQLLERFIAGKDVWDTPNCWLKLGGKIIKNQVMNLREDLDGLPLPAWELFDQRHLISSPDGGHTIRREGGIETSRGCPFSCAYCFTDRMRRLYKGKGRFCRQKSIDRIILEAKNIRDRLELTYLHFIDDNFINSLPRLEALAARFAREVGLPLFVQASADRITKKSAELLAKMGTKDVGIGVEVGDDRYRREILRKPVTNDRLVQAFTIIRESGMKPWAYYMIGMPFQTREQLDATVRLDRKLRPEKAFVSTYYPFPGTVLFDLLVSEGQVVSSGEGPDYFSGLASIRLPGLSVEEVEEYREYFPTAYRRETTARRRDLRAVRDGRGIV